MSVATTVSFSINTDTVRSGEIDPRFFGANTLFDHDSLAGTYGDKVTTMGVNLLRFPGGGIAENDFDITNPDALGVVGQEDNETLSNFLSFCAAQGLTPAVVIPTKRYLGDIDTGVAEVTQFVADLTGGVYGPADGLILEIGNEFYADTDDIARINAEEYGQIASQFAEAADAAATIPTVITVQAGRTKLQNDAVMASFDTAAEIDAIGGVIVHQYPWRAEVVERRFEKQQKRLDEWADFGVDGITFMSEWNVGSSPDDSADPSHDYGAAQMPALLEIIYHATAYDIDYAAIWGVQQNTKTALSPREGNAPLLAAGMVYQLASTSLVGKQVLLDAASTSADGTSFAHFYEDAHEYVAFVSAGDFDAAAGALEIKLELSGLTAGFVSVDATKVSVTSPGDEPRPEGVMTTSTPEVSLDGDTPVLSFTFDADYEVMQLRFTKVSAVVDDLIQNGGEEGDFLAAGMGDDLLRGRRGADVLQANDGDDQLFGGGGDDQLNGGAGADTLTGGAGDDELLGDEGADVLMGKGGRDDLQGGAGDDTLTGGGGRDELRGGDGDDVLNGGDASDRFWGGGGADSFVFEGNFGTDRIFGFEIGVDKIDFSALGSVSDFTQVTGLTSQNNYQTVIALAEGTVILRGFDMTTLNATDFLF